MKSRNIIFLLASSLMVLGCGKGSKPTLAEECQAYLKAGPPAHMKDYVPGSMTEIIIAHGAQNKKLDPELVEIGSIVAAEVESLKEIDDPEIKAYMLRGAELVKRVLEFQATKNPESRL